MEVGYEAIKAIYRLLREEYSSEEERSLLMETVDRAKKKDMTIDEMTYFYNKKNSWKKDEELDKTKAVTKVRNTFPGTF